MTRSDTLTLLKIPGDIFIESPNKHKIISFLTERLNTGYNTVRYKYGVIQSTRIKNEAAFINDLGIKSSGSFILLVIADKQHSKDRTIQDLNNNSIQEKEINDCDISIDELDQEQILGTIGVKPKILEDDLDKKGWEITGFTSFQKGVGRYLIGRVEKLAKELGLDFVFASCIQEHELVPYYSQYGFQETGTSTLLEIDETGRVKGDTLEDGIYASRDFHVAELVKYLK